MSSNYEQTSKVVHETFFLKKNKNNDHKSGKLYFLEKTAVRDAPKAQHSFLTYSRIFPSQFGPNLTNKISVYATFNEHRIFSIGFLQTIELLPKPCNNFACGRSSGGKHSWHHRSDVDLHLKDL